MLVRVTHVVHPGLFYVVQLDPSACCVKESNETENNADGGAWNREETLFSMMEAMQEFYHTSQFKHRIYTVRLLLKVKVAF